MERTINDGGTEGGFLDAKGASALLGVKPETLYAYVSRGLLRSVPSPEGRGHGYSRTDLERLKARSDARAGHGPVAGAALRWGEPVLDSSLTALGAEGPRYRGQLATELAERDVPFEAVAELLWTGSLPELATPFRAGRPKLSAKKLSSLLADGAPLLAGAQLALAAIAAQDFAGYGVPLSTELARARSLIATLAAAPALSRAPERFDRALAEDDVARAVIVALGGRPRAASAAAMNRALVLCADHELNVSTFAARITASGGADLYACVTAALAALTGPRHGGACDRVEALVAETGEPTRARAVVHDRTRRGESVPGFGHPLYPKGDPRADQLIDLARSINGKASVVRTLMALVRVMRDEGREPPTLDVGLVAVCAALGLPYGAPVCIFALGRSAGWIAHVFEQRTDAHMLRPRARYVGV